MVFKKVKSVLINIGIEFFNLVNRLFIIGLSVVFILIKVFIYLKILVFLLGFVMLVK